MAGRTLRILVGAQFGKPWAAKVIDYPDDQTPELAFGPKASRPDGYGKKRYAYAEVSDLEPGDLIYRTVNERCHKAFSQVRRTTDGLVDKSIGTGNRVREVFAEIRVLRDELQTRQAAWHEELAGLQVEKFSDLVRAFEIIARFLKTGFFDPLNAPQLARPGDFSEHMLVKATETLLQYLLLYPEHADFLRLAANKLSEYKTVKARLVQNRIESAST